MTILENLQPILHAIEWAAIIALFYLSGIAWCFNLWVVPIIKLNPTISAINQFEETSRRGGIWLEPLNAFIAGLLAVIAFIKSHDPEVHESHKWGYFALASFTLVQVAWWERVFIFPLDDAASIMKDNKGNFKLPERQSLLDGSKLRLDGIMGQWTKKHAVRATLPFVAALIAVTSKMGN